MATFTEFMDILPDPINKIGNAGQSSATGSAGPGFASVKLSSNSQTLRDRTNSGRLISRSNAYQTWTVEIGYNPMTRAEFRPIESFLMEKQGSLKPFFVILPQYTGNSINTTVSVTAEAGATRFLADTTTCAVGDIFNIEDPSDAKHTKTYKITRIETATDYNTALGSPGAGTMRIHFMPALSKRANAGAVVQLATPKIKVINTSDVQEYTLDTENLYSFGLKLEEAN